MIALYELRTALVIVLAFFMTMAAGSGSV